ncbi:aldo/keto reductase [Ilumatobacter nonamiensis]|uniref:aldo/keto reductase n=1 Tax=Ilumatobacter nonamiensis TaxID=467093 RepID=UPI000348CE15|nr:aldo/keto reductase [Ilumatobacter nonamiensis]
MLPRAAFGSTGHDSTRVIFGAAALGAMSQERADATLDAVTGWGINHIDTAASYGESEVRLRPWLTSHRDEVFLATKSGERGGDGARAELERSLERLGVDSVDLIQLHNLVDEDGWQQAFASGGAVDALAAARDEGLVAHIGVTGHGVPIAEMHLRSLERFDFASVLFPVNFVMMENPRYRGDVERLLDVCAERSVAVQTIKSIARGAWADGSTNHFSWYDPLTEAEPIGRAVRYVLSHPQMFLNTTSDARLLPMIVEAAEGDLTMPDRALMLDDVEAEGITPLFVEGEPAPV